MRKETDFEPGQSDDDAEAEHGQPTLDELEAWLDDGLCEALDGCIVELDGHCPHGSPAWPLYLGLI